MEQVVLPSIMPQISKMKRRNSHNPMHNERMRKCKLGCFDSILLSGVRRQGIASTGSPIMQKFQVEHVERLSARLSIGGCIGTGIDVGCGAWRVWRTWG